MEMRNWVTPEVTVQGFEMNDYVAATCWKVGCASNTTSWNSNSGAPGGNHWSESEVKDQWFNHNGDCKEANNNYFRVDEDGTITFVYESSSEQGNLKGGFDYWDDRDGSKTVTENDVIYWYTANDTLRWNHWGYVQLVNPLHANRS